MAPPAVEVLCADADAAARHEADFAAAPPTALAPRAVVQRRGTVEGGATVRDLSTGATDAGARGAPVAIRRVALPPGASWSASVPSHWTAFVHVRKGAVRCGAEDLPTGTLALLNKDGASVVVENPSATDDADILFLSAEPLKDPVVASGTFVVTNEFELQQATRDYQAGMMGVPWDAALSDEEWRAGLRL